MVVDELSRRLDGQWKTEPKLKSDIFATDFASQPLVLAKPQTMMNLSGDAVQRLVQKYKLKPADVWVIHDDVDVQFGKLRLRRGASSGQQGIRSITDAIGPNFIHVRMGISLNDRAVEPSEVYVLKPFNDSEAANLPELIQAAASSILDQIAQPAPDETTVELLPSVDR